MAQPGPAPRPHHLRVANGVSANRDSGGRLVQPPPMFERGAPEKPGIVQQNDDASEAWDRIVPELARLDLLKPIDQDMLSAYCLTYSRMLSAQREIEALGIIVTGERGGLVRNPACGVAAEAAKELRMWASEFGLTPSAEGRLQPPPGAGDDNGDGAFD